MKLFLALFKYNVKKTFQYRWSSLVSLVTDPLMLILFINLLTTVYSHNGSSSVLGYSLTQMIWYFGATKFFFYLVVCYTDRSLSDSIVSGSMVIKLIKPVPVIVMEFSEAASSKMTTILYEFIPNFIIYSLLVPPSFMDTISFTKYILLTMLAFVLFFLLSFLFGIIAFEWENSGSFAEVKNFVLSILSGAAVPLEFFPGSIQAILKFLPFQYMFYVPIRIFLNMPETHSMAYFVNAMSMLLIWIGILYVMSIVLWKRYSRHFSAVG